RMLTHLGVSLTTAGDPEAAVAFLRKAQRQHPGDFSINYALASCLSALKPTPWDEVVAFRRAAIAVRPRTAWAHNQLGIALRAQQKLAEAIAASRRCSELAPKHAFAHKNLGNALRRQGKLDEAIAAYRQAVRVSPDAPAGHDLVVETLQEAGKPEEV